MGSWSVPSPARPRGLPLLCRIKIFISHMILEIGQNHCHVNSLHGRATLETCFEFVKAFLSDLRVFAAILAESGTHLFSACYLYFRVARAIESSVVLIV